MKKTQHMKQKAQVEPRAARVVHRPRPQGWTLTELLMVIAIMALLAAIAWPNYTQYVQRGYRLEAVATLLEAQHFMERYYTAFGRYSLLATPGATPVAPALPTRLQTIPAADTRYLVSVTQVSANSYMLSAVPTGSMANDKCGSLTLNHISDRGTTSGLAVAECWR